MFISRFYLFIYFYLFYRSVCNTCVRFFNCNRRDTNVSMMMMMMTWKYRVHRIARIPRWRILSSKATKGHVQKLQKTGSDTRSITLTRDPTRPDPAKIVDLAGDPWPKDPVPALPCNAMHYAMPQGRLQLHTEHTHTHTGMHVKSHTHIALTAVFPSIPGLALWCQFWI